MSEDDLICINRPEAKPPQKRKNTVRPAQVAWFCVLLAVLAGTALLFGGDAPNFDGVRRFFTYGIHPSEVGFAPIEGGLRSCAALDGSLAAANADGLYLLGAKGESQKICPLEMDAPTMVACGQWLGVYDAGGSQLVLADSDGNVAYEASGEGPILDLAVSEEGCIAYSMLAEPYKTVLVVLDEDQQPLFRWNSGSHYFGCCALSSDASMLAAVQLGQENSAFCSSVLLFATDQTQPYATVPLGEQTIFRLLCLTDDRLCAIGEQSAVFFDAEGQILKQYDYGGAKLTGFSAAEDTVLLALHQANDSLLVSLDETGAVWAKLEQTGEIRSVSGCGRYLAVLGEDSLTLYSRDLTVLNERKDCGEVSRALAQGDGTAIGIGEEAHLFFFN